MDDQPLRLDGEPRFVLSPDDPVAFDAWDIDHHAARSGKRVADELKLHVVRQSEVRAILESEPVAIGESSSLQVRYVLDAGSLHLKIEAQIDWQESHRLLRYVVPTAYRGRHARFGCPFGSIERPQLPGTESDEAMWEVPGSRWAAVQDDGGSEGLAILAESKLGYAARDGVLSLSLLRAPKWPDAYADMGSHQIRFAIGRLRLETTEQWFGTSLAADSLFSPPLRYDGPAIGGKFHWHTLGTLNASWCGPAAVDRGGYFLRLHEVAGQPGTARLRLSHPASHAALVDFRDETIATLGIDAVRQSRYPLPAVADSHAANRLTPKPGIWDRRPGWCRRPPVAAVVAVSCGSTRMPGFFLHACQPRRWERSQAGVSGVRAVGTPAGPGRAKNPGFALGDSQPGPHRKKPGFGGGQSPAFGTGGPDGEEDRRWQRSLRCRAAAPECRDFSGTPVSRGDGSVLRQAYRVSGRLVHQPARAARRIPASRLAIRSRARDGRSRASGEGKARHLGPAARMV